MIGSMSRATGLAFVLALLSQPAQAGEITCTSQSAGYRYCRADTSTGVSLMEQLGPFACNKGNTWDYDKNGVWVANGCAARFWLGPSRKADELEAKAQGTGAETLARDLTSGNATARKRSAAAPRAAPAPVAAEASDAQATSQTKMAPPKLVVCESKQYKRQTCPVPVRAHVHLMRKLGRAECRFNATWGYDYGEIWVDQGCRAEFAIE